MRKHRALVQQLRPAKNCVIQSDFQPPMIIVSSQLNSDIALSYAHVAHRASHSEIKTTDKKNKKRIMKVQMNKTFAGIKLQQ